MWIEIKPIKWYQIDTILVNSLPIASYQIISNQLKVASTEEIRRNKPSELLFTRSNFFSLFLCGGRAKRERTSERAGASQPASQSRASSRSTSQPLGRACISTSRVVAQKRERSKGYRTTISLCVRVLHLYPCIHLSLSIPTSVWHNSRTHSRSLHHSTKKVPHTAIPS